MKTHGSITPAVHAVLSHDEETQHQLLLIEKKHTFWLSATHIIDSKSIVGISEEGCEMNCCVKMY